MEIKKLGMLAGSGQMPIEIVKHCKQKGIDIFVVGLEPFANEKTVEGAPHIFARMGEVGKILKALRDYGVQEIVMAGGIKRPSLKELIPDWEGVKLLAKISFKTLSDDSLFRTVIKEVENYGFKLVGIEDVVPEMLFADGIYGKVKPSEDDMSDIMRGIEVAKALGAVDVGQAVVVQEGIVLAVEAVEGTDAMLSRAASVKRAGKGPVMVKIKKPGQEVRTDMPAMGRQTVEQLKIYGMRGIAVEAGGILLIEKDEVIRMADEAGIFIIGVKVR